MKHHSPEKHSSSLILPLLAMFFI